MQNSSEIRTASRPKSGDTVQIPRWIVYFQGAMLGVVAATFFIFGLMVGQVTSPPDTGENQQQCRVVGEVWLGGEESRPDVGAVVLMLPTDHQPTERQDPRHLNPRRFRPLDNNAIDMIHRLGGAVSRADERGRFDVVVDSPGNYQCVVLSAGRQPTEFQPLEKFQKAVLATFFNQTDRLIGEQSCRFIALSISGTQRDMGAIEF